MPRRALPALAGLLLSISSACAADKVSVGILNAAGDIGMFIAEARGGHAARQARARRLVPRRLIRAVVLRRRVIDA